MILSYIEKITKENLRDNIELEQICSLDDCRNDCNVWISTALGLSHTLMQAAFFYRRKELKVRQICTTAARNP